jgi:hypothetical protein
VGTPGDIDGCEKEGTIEHSRWDVGGSTNACTFLIRVELGLRNGAGCVGWAHRSNQADKYRRPSRDKVTAIT